MQIRIVPEITVVYFGAILFLASFISFLPSGTEIPCGPAKWGSD